MAAQQEVALRRLRQITSAAVPQPVAPRPALVACASNLAELEGEAIGRFTSTKVVLLKTTERGAALASQSELEMQFRKRSLDPVLVEQVGDIPKDATVVVTQGTAITDDILAKMPNLKLVAVAFTGTDHVDLAACKARGVAVCNAPNYSTDATAELAIGMIISHLRRLQTCHETVRGGLWAGPPQEDLQSKTVGIVGVGKIGLRLAELFKAFKVKGLQGFSLTQEAEFMENGGIYADSLAGLFLDSDIVCVCLPLTPKTEGIVSDKLLDLMRPDSILVNVSRGGVVDEVALAKPLKQGRFRAALDVFRTEPLPTGDLLRDVPAESLLLTPHVGYQSAASLEKRLDITIKNILAFLAGQAINLVA